MYSSVINLLKRVLALSTFFLTQFIYKFKKCIFEKTSLKKNLYKSRIFNIYIIEYNKNKNEVLMEKVNIDNIKQMVRNGKVRWTIVRLFQRNISQEDIKNALFQVV